MLDIKKPWVKLILWISAFLSPIAYVLVGGFVFLSVEDEELREENKKVFIISLIFVCSSVVLSVWSSVLGMMDYSSSAYKAYSVASSLISLIKTVCFVVFGLLALFTKSEEECACCNHSHCGCEEHSEETETISDSLAENGSENE